jgi:hypothetical protein
VAGTVRIVLGVLLVLFGLATLIFLVGIIPLLLGLVFIFWGVDARRRASTPRVVMVAAPAVVVPPTTAALPQAGLAGMSPGVGASASLPCPRCGRGTTYIAPERKNYCSTCRQYV